MPFEDKPYHLADNLCQLETIEPLIWKFEKKMFLLIIIN